MNVYARFCVPTRTVHAPMLIEEPEITIDVEADYCAITGEAETIYVAGKPRTAEQMLAGLALILGRAPYPLPRLSGEEIADLLDAA